MKYFFSPFTFRKHDRGDSIYRSYVLFKISNSDKLFACNKQYVARTSDGLSGSYNV